MDKISVIIPVYNSEQYLEECFDSLKNQTYKNLEIIVVNDGSNETCTKLLIDIASKDPRVILFHLQSRVGVGAARNYGVKKATGELVYFLDSDDYLPESTLELLQKNIGENELIRGRMRSTNLSTSFVIIYDGLSDVKMFDSNKYNLIENNSAQNFLIKKSFIEEMNLAFSEDVEVYSDLTFMIPALDELPQVPFVREAIYFRRRRNDPITNPALSQSKDLNMIKDFLHIYNILKTQFIYKDELTIEFLDKHILNFYRKDVVRYAQDEDYINTIFSDLNKSLNLIDDNVIQKYDLFFKTEIKAIKRNNLKKYKRVNKRHQFLRELRNGLKTKRRFMIFLYRKIFMKLPVKKDLVFFESFLAKSYSDNPKYIYEHMIENNMNYKYVWSFREKKEIPGNAIQVKRFSLRYFYYLARSKYWVANIRLPRYLDKRKENIYLQTWHGTPLKTLVFDQDEIFSADPNYKINFYQQSRRWDYLNSANQYSSDIFRNAFKYDKEMLEYGYPRNDILYKKNTPEHITTIKNTLNIPKDKKVILYAPTWRDDEFFSRGNYKFTLKLELDKMQKELGNEYIVLLRTHYHIANILDVSEFKGFVYDFSLYDDIAELYLVSDMLITDYSSVFFDYANLKRPILFYTYDLEKYRDELRGFYIDIETEVPGPLLMNTNEVIHSIKNIDDIVQKYQNKYDVFYDRFCSWEDGNASKNTVQRVFEEK